jgi:uncharacterized membrane protein YfcA
MFLATFGVSDTPLAIAVYKKAKKVDDKLLPGTCVTEAIIPLGAMSLAFLSTIEVDMMTLVCCIIAQSLGALIGVNLIVKLNEHHTRIAMGTALALTAVFIFIKMCFFQDTGGTAIGLVPWKLAIACIVLFITGALSMVGMGATIPNIATLLLLGIDVKAVFPIVMTCAVISCFVGAVQFVRSGQYTRKAVIASVVGVIGVLCAVGLVNKMDPFILQMGMLLLLIYCAIAMFWSEYNVKRVS